MKKMKQYRLTEGKMVECIKFDYTPTKNRYVKLDDLIAWLNDVTYSDEDTGGASEELLEQLTAAIPGSE
jgi:hypothetical protein